MIRAAPRRAALPLLIGALVAAGVSGGARAEPAGGGCAHDAALEAAVASALRKKVRDIESTPGVRIEITFGCPAVSEPRQVTALSAHGHGGFVNVLELTGAGEARALRLKPAAAPTLSGPPPKVTRATARPRAEAIQHALAFASAALASTIHVALPPPVPGAVQTISARATTHDEALEIRLTGTGGVSSTRRWDGYVDSTHAAARVPLEVAWEALWELAGGPLRPAPVEEPDRAAFQRLLDSDGPRPRFLNDGLLELGAVLATRPVVPSLTPFLQAPSERTQLLAVNALATATGTDLRRDAAGALRPLADVTAAYRALAAPPPAPRH
ncbi:MAG TPA: hypothetical protein VMT03_24830 [Polyangia bacterium]|nr:hypothetical protein [Polyangia bacterium]